MDIHKPVALAAAILITAGSLYGIATYGGAAGGGATPQNIQATGPAALTLPIITVRPTRQQLQELRGHAIPAGPVSTAVNNTLLMPFYSTANGNPAA